MRELVFFLAIVAGVCAQDVALPSKPPDNGPSLVDTMKFIQDKLNSNGNVSWTYTWNNSVAQTSGGPLLGSERAYSATGDAAACKLTLHFRATDDGRALDGYSIVSFQSVDQIEVMGLKERLDRKLTKGGHPETTYMISPTVSVVVLRRRSGAEVDFKFSDAEMADRMAKAMLHAVEVCGGGSKDPF